MAKPIGDCTDCGRHIRLHTKQRCGACYMRLRKQSAPLETCKRCQHQKKLFAKGFCSACYNHNRKYGRARSYARITDNTYGQPRHCLEPGCANQALDAAPWGLGFCADCMPKVQKALASHQGLVRKSAA